LEIDVSSWADAKNVKKLILTLKVPLVFGFLFGSAKIERSAIYALRVCRVGFNCEAFELPVLDVMMHVEAETKKRLC